MAQKTTFVTNVKKFFGVPVQKIRTAADVISGMIRPGTNQFRSLNYLVPNYPFHPNTLYEISYYSDVLTTVHTALRNEIFRNGVEVVEAEKTDPDVTDAGMEVPEEVLDPEEKKNILDFIERVNNNNQSAVEMCKEVEDDLNILDKAYVIFINQYDIGNDGEIVDWLLQEMIRADPVGMVEVMNKQRMFGFDDDGNELLFDPEDRSQLFENQSVNNQTGNRLMRAYYKHTSSAGVKYYARDEVVRLVKYRPWFGFSPVMTVWQKVFGLFAQDTYIKEYYEGKRPPKGMLAFYTANKESLQDAWEDMIARHREDPHLPGIMAIQPTPGNTSGKVAEWIDFMRSLDELQFVQQREEFRRTIGSVFHVSPVFQNDISTSGGLNNEGLQVTVTNRGVEIGQQIYNDVLFPHMIKLLKYPGWRVQLRPSEEQDEMARLERQEKALENAKMAANMGLDVVYDETSGDAKISSGKVEPMMIDFGTREDDDRDPNDDEDDDKKPKGPVSGEPKTPPAKVSKRDIKNIPNFVEDIGSQVEKDLIRIVNSLKKSVVNKVRTVNKLTPEDGLTDRIQKLADDVTDDFVREGRAVMRGKGREVALGAVAWITNKFASKFDVRTTFDQIDETALDFFQKAQFDRIKGVSEDIRNSIKNQVTIGVMNGESEKKIADRIGKSFSASKHRLRTIARTETKRVFDHVSLERYKDAGVKKVEWITARDDRVRPVHQSLDGRTWKADSSRIPRDVLAEPNCRCVLVPV